MTRFAWRGSTQVIVSSFALLSSGCALFDPYVQADKTKRDTARTQPTLTNAIAYGADLREKYLEAISEHAKINSITGVALIPLSAATIGLGATGGQPNTILGLGLGGGSIYLSGNFLYSKPRQMVYAAGANAIGCSIATMGPLSVADEASHTNGNLTESLADLDVAITELEVVMNANTGRVSMDSANQILMQAKKTLEQGRQAQVALAEAGPVLLESLDKIQDTVTRSLIQTEPDLTALTNSLSSALPMYAGKISPAAASRLSMPQKQGDADLKAPVPPSLPEAEKKAASAAEKVDTYVKLVGAGPPQDVLRACTTDAQITSATLSVLPAEQTITRPTGRQEVDVAVSGGLGKYTASWVGAVPSDIDMTKDYLTSTSATIKLSVGPKASAAAELLISDSGGLQKVFDLTITGTVVSDVPPGKVGADGSPPAKNLPPNSKVRKVQQLLTKMKLFNGAPNGLSGLETRNSLSTFIATAGAGKPDSAELDRLLLVDIDKLTKWLEDQVAPADWRQEIAVTTDSSDPSTQPNPAVLKLQKLLDGDKLYSGPLDGIAGKATRDAVRKLISNANAGSPSDTELDALVTVFTGKTTDWALSGVAPADWRQQISESTTTSAPVSTVITEESANNTLLQILVNRHCVTKPATNSPGDVDGAVKMGLSTLTIKYVDLKNFSFTQLYDLLSGDTAKKYICQ